MEKKVVVLGGGTGMSALLIGLKQFPMDISAIVSVSDDGRSTGRLREEFGIPAVGDVRKVLVALSKTEPLVEKLLDYRFNTTSDLDGHTVGNLILTAATNICGNMNDGIEALSTILNLKGKVVPLTEENVHLVGEMADGTIIEGEHNITEAKKKIVNVYYKEKAKADPNAIKTIMDADLIILSMGSVYTSVIPNLICPEIIAAIDASRAPIMYACNMMTQPGETDDFKVSDHIALLNRYLGERKISVVVANEGMISEEMRQRYETLEQKDPVTLDKENLNGLTVISDDYVSTENGLLRHDGIKVALDIFAYMLFYRSNSKETPKEYRKTINKS